MARTAYLESQKTVGKFAEGPCGYLVRVEKKLRRSRRATFCLYMIILATFLILARCKPAPPPGMTDPGQIIYLGYKDTYASCARCHGDEGQGTSDAPEIRNSIAELGRKEARKILVFGKSKSKDWNEEMPAFGEELTPEEIGYVLDFITHWGKADSTNGSQDW
jgi:mono/diheme cytochrome c family protein